MVSERLVRAAALLRCLRVIHAGTALCEAEGEGAGALSEGGHGALLGLCQADKKIEKKKRQKVPARGGLPRGL